MRNRNNYVSLPYNPELRDRAKELRRAGNYAEVLMWRQFHRKKFRGYDFDRQKIIGNYIVDFYCLDCNTVVEIDGNSHDTQAEYDQERDSYLLGLGLRVIHILARDVLNNIDGIMEWLYDHPALRASLPEEE
jgi:very-short-patch-repair endonuclease